MAGPVRAALAPGRARLHVQPRHGGHDSRAFRDGRDGGRRPTEGATDRPPAEAGSRHRLLTEDDCAFCRILSGEVDAHVVLDDDDTLAFLDHRPLFPGHVLLIPRAHIETLPDLPD